MLRRIAAPVVIFMLGMLSAATAAAEKPAPAVAVETAASVSPQPIGVIDPNSPRASGKEFQYENLTTRLGGKHYISDVLLPDLEWHTWDGKPLPIFDLNKQNAQNYDSSHNHYQTMLVELANATPQANGVPLWSDGTAAVNGSLAWGAFVSARSSCAALVTARMPSIVNKPEAIGGKCPSDFDAQLTGLEVDVLNDGKPGVYGNKAKHGLQVVGFGNPNSHALSVISHGFDRPEGQQDGQFESVLYAQKALHPDYGRLIVSDQTKAMIGLDFRKTLYSQGAISLHTAGAGTGVLFDSGTGGELTSGPRSQDDKTGSWATLRAGTGGVRLMSHDGTKEVLAADAHGGVYINGDLYLNGHKLAATSSSPAAKSYFAAHWLRTAIVAALAAAVLAVLLVVGVILLLVRRGRFGIAGRSV